MKIVTDRIETNNFLCTMRSSFVDRLSWREWYALEITGKPALKRMTQNKVTSLITEALSAYEGNIFWTEDSVLVVFKKPGPFNVRKFAGVLPKQLTTPKISCQVFCVNEDHEQLESMIKRHLQRALPSKKFMDSYLKLKEVVPHIDALLKEWKVSVKNRVGRTEPCIMVVDDDAMTLHMVQHAFDKDYSILTAQTGLEAIEKHIQNAPDIIFLDIGLPDINGLTLLNYMRLYDMECQIVMFSADGEVLTRFEALSHGARGFAAKPFNRELFTNYIATWKDRAILHG